MMDSNDVSEQRYRAPRRIFLLSWIAYVRPLVLFAVLSAIGLLVSQSAKTANIILIGYAILFIGIAKVIYDIAWRRRFRFFYDEDGVWLSRGLLPWRRKSGLAWLEIDDIACQAGSLSWLTKSYGVFVSNRFSQSRQLHIRHIKHGDQAVEAISEKLAEDFPD